jgi:hypothetical protein
VQQGDETSSLLLRPALSECVLSKAEEKENGEEMTAGRPKKDWSNWKCKRCGTDKKEIWERNEELERQIAALKRKKSIDNIIWSGFAIVAFLLGLLLGEWFL